ncbi:pyridoxal phosphate-dependent transferase [Paraphoma chrysanthemicola]|nr:pyridoxal phosphate-dependent transferase [Paraphoma chrysanthemicola]
MEAGLSLRAAKTLDAFLPAAAPHANPNTVCDVSTAQNEVLRPELLEFFKSTVEDQVTSSAFALPAPGGDPLLREALASFFNKYFHPVHAVKPQHIIPTAGASDAIEKIVHAVCDDGDSVLVPGPAWHGFNPMLKARPNVNIIVAQPPTYANWDNYLVPSLQAVYDFSAEKSRIKAVLLCNPHNPLSRCYSKNAILELMEFCQEHNLHLIVDEIYALTNLTTAPARAPKFVSALSLSEPLVPEGAVKVDPSRVHVVWSASKLFGMSGFRIGCIISQQNPTLLQTLSLLTTSPISAISSIYLTSLLSWSQLPTLLNLNSERLTSSYTILAESLRTCKIDFITPTHGLFLWAKIARSAAEVKSVVNGLSSVGIKLSQDMVVKGGEGDVGWVRIRFAMSAREMSDVARRLEGYFAGR